MRGQVKTLFAMTLVLIAGNLGTWQVTSALPIQKDKPKPALFYPTQVGTKRVYEQAGKDNYVEVITDVTTKGEVTLVTVQELVDGKLEPSDVVSVTENGLSSLYRGKDKLDPPITFLKLDAKPGESWKVESSAADRKFKVRFTFTGEEEVKVPAGRYKALKLESEMTSNGRTFTATAWYAKGVGMVKSVSPGGTQELKSITVAKK
jgi:hypothetical protein